MIIEITPDNELHYPKYRQEYDKDSFKIFLAGTIDNGESEDWQSKLIWKLALYTCSNDNEIDLGSGYDFSLGAEDNNDIIVFNPRRDNWNKSFTEKQLEEQIKWEQDHLDEADLIIMYLADNSKSPISLLELGLYGPDGKMIVFCTENFYRATNVKLTCWKYLIPLIQSTDINNAAKEIEKIYNDIK